MGKTYALITGASGGIGKELAIVFAENHHNLILTARNHEKLTALKKQLEQKYNIDVKTAETDLSAVDAAQKLYDEIKGKNYEVDNLVNNAGFGDWSDFLSSDWQRQYDMVQLNITAMMQLTYLFGNDMKRRHYGCIMNLSSVAAFCAGPYMSVYYASKSYVLNFSQALSEELRDTGVSVTALCPGPTRTGFEVAARMRGSRMFTALPTATARDVAKCGYRAMQKEKAIVYHGPVTRCMSIGARFISKKRLGRIAGRINGKP